MIHGPQCRCHVPSEIDNGGTMTPPGSLFGLALPRGQGSVNG